MNTTRLHALALFLSCWSASLSAQEAPQSRLSLQMVSPTNGAVLDSFLTAALRWKYPERPGAPFPFLKVNLEVSSHEDLSRPIVDVDRDDSHTGCRLALVPETTYYWQLTPFDIVNGVRTNYLPWRATGHFTTGKPRNEFNAADRKRYENPRAGAHWQYLEPVPFAAGEPLSPWYDVKAYKTTPPPTLAAIKDRFPVPVLEGHPESLEAYWYC
ncbi:MAG: hypothetical protein M1608_14735, partial [Candidatus Omnitrophica bacterium]|nr:hypothetical protein [Candidatus Omnitrophota bacterium]